ncbi:MAG: DUF1232 domain-containing protein [Candidatus Hydrogenedentes bacterium]|nr:DUF1232 domain-containing protein [Candidatus Hydrogenedentota bacterium]
MGKEKVVVVAEEGPGCFGQGVAVLGVLASGFWLLNFSAGFVEIPDYIPVVGNLDEAAAAAVMFSCLRYLGFDILPFGKRGARKADDTIDIKASKD